MMLKLINEILILNRYEFIRNLKHLIIQKVKGRKDGLNDKDLKSGF